MATIVKVKAVGHGLGYNRYLVEFEFRMNNTEKDYDDEHEFISAYTGRAIQQAKRKTACDFVTISSIKIRSE